MKNILSWLIVLSLILLMLNPLVMFLNNNPILALTALAVGGLSFILLIIILVMERIKDKEEEKDDLNKY